MVDKELYDEYDAALLANAGLVALAVEQIAALADGVPERELAELFTEGYTALVSTFGAQAAAIAVEFYMRQRAASGVSSDFTPQQYQADVGNLLPHDVAQALEAGKSDPAGIANALKGVAQQRVMESADQTLVSNARRDPAHAKWALVPHAGACDWCKMLGSRGFEYTSSGTVDSSRHPNCLCTPVVDFSDDPALEGYDVDGLRDYYDENLKAKWGGRRGGSRRARRKPVKGLETSDKIYEYLSSADSIEELTERYSAALAAADALWGGKKSVLKAQRNNIWSIGNGRYNELLKKK